MAFYEDLEQKINTAVYMLLSNQNICKLVTYFPKNQDYRYDPYAQPDIENPSSLLLNGIFPIPKTPDADTKQNCFINITVSGGDRMKQNSGFRRVLLHFDIICHLDCWFIKNGFRPIRIMSEIDKMFNNQNTEIGTINRPQPLPFYAKDYSNRFYGYELTYELLLNSNIECE